MSDIGQLRQVEDSQKNKGIARAEQKNGLV